MSNIKTNDKFTYNSSTKKYVFHTEEKFGKNFVFREDKINNIIKLYSNFDDVPLTMGDISKKMGIPKEVVKYILGSLSVTHDSLPFTKEKLDINDEDELVEEMELTKAFSVQQKFERKDWKKTQADAEKWRTFSLGEVDLYKNLLENWNPPKYVPVKTKLKLDVGEDELVIFASDWHYGIVANERYLANQKEWDINKTVEVVQEYCEKLKANILKKKYKKIHLVFGGDIIHTLTGFTDKGTKLEANPLGSEVLEKAFDSVINFINGLLEVHNNINVYAVNGNHSELGDHVLYRMAELFYKTDKRLKFSVTDERFLFFKIYDNIFLVDHGYSAKTKSRLPNKGVGRENYINNIFLASGNNEKVKNRYYLSGDQHHLESYELTNVEGYMFPSLVGGCRYADNSGYKARVRQNALVVNKEGVSEVINFYFE